MLKNTSLFAVLLAVCLFASTTSYAQDAAAKQRVDQLIAVLKAPDASRDAKAAACRQLSYLATNDAIAPLAALLPNEEMNHMARYALEPIPDPAVDDAFRDALPKLKGLPLVGVIGSIGVRKDAKAVPALAKFLTDPDPIVSQAAARALGKIGTTEAAKAIQAALPNTPAQSQLAFCEGLFRAAESLAEKDQTDTAVSIYDDLRKLNSSHHQVRAGALRGAVLARKTGRTPILIEAVRSDDYVLTAAAARTAIEIADPDLTPALTAELPKLSTDKQILVIQVLAKRADPAALPALFSLAKADNKTTRIAAIKAMPEIGHVSALPVLLDLMKDSDRDIAQLAQNSLASLPGNEADAAVLAMLATDNTQTRLIALDFIGRRRMSACVPDLLKAAADPDPKIRPLALKRLGELANPTQLPALFDLLIAAKDQSEIDAAQQAVESVSSRADKPEQNVQTLVSLLNNADTPHKTAILKVLTVIGGSDALAAVRAAMNAPNADPQVRATAIRSLGSWKNADAAPDLLNLAKTGNSDNDKILGLRNYLGLASRPELSEPQRLAMCKEAAPLVKRPEEKRLLVSTLGNIASADSLAAISPYLADPDIKEEACQAAVAAAAKLVQTNDAKNFPAITDSMTKVAAASTNPDLVRRAKSLQQQVQRRTRN